MYSIENNMIMTLTTAFGPGVMLRRAKEEFSRRLYPKAALQVVLSDRLNEIWLESVL